jgi:hypothetical protein
MVAYDPIAAAARCPTIEPSMAPRKVSGEPGTCCKIKGNHDTQDPLAIVVYDPVEVAARCPALMIAVDSCMVPKKVAWQPHYLVSTFDLAFTHVLADQKKSSERLCILHQWLLDHQWLKDRYNRLSFASHPTGYPEICGLHLSFHITLLERLS